MNNFTATKNKKHIKMRETFEVKKSDIEDYSGKGPWKINGETYVFKDKFKTNGDGEWTAVIVQRKSDKKLFKFEWGYDGGDYYYEPEWEEVKVKKILKKIYTWDND